MWKVPLFRIFQDDEDVRNVTSVIKRGEYWAIGPEIQEFENEIAKYSGSKYCAVFNSGTSALHAALLACKIGAGSRIAVPSFSFIASANCSLFVDSRPVFVDIEESTLGMDPNQLAYIMSSQKIDAVIPVHYAGCSCEIKAIIEEVGRKSGKSTVVIEDAAESFGGTVDGKMTGTFGTAGVLSFAPNKVITTGEGGAVITDSREIYERLLLARSHGRLDTVNYFESADAGQYIELGYNFRMASMVAALGVSQIRKAEKIIQMRIEKAKYYNQKLKHASIRTPNEPKGLRHVYQIYSIRAKNRDALAKKLTAAGIMTKVYFMPIHLTPFYRERFGYRGGELPVTEKVSSEILALPIFPTLSKGEMDLICEEVIAFYGEQEESKSSF